jgi:hypothetical protein
MESKLNLEENKVLNFLKRLWNGEFSTKNNPIQLRDWF